MHVTRLRLSGFKSFVEPTDFPVEPGLTGVIGPNGCGKSNLLEALRWVMGAASAKAMRGEGMDDVIFAGAAGRAPRSHAEVTLSLDNTDPGGPAAHASSPILEVTRRIDRGQGSTYRINGAEARARDVQLLFADASTGANSPALVRQGQISELIAARPQNRRRILEEAAGIAGLHGRRHEALLRVNAAEANLARLEDLAREVEASQARLKREARTAARYRNLTREIAKVGAGLSHARWAQADRARAAAGEAARIAMAEAIATTRDAAGAATALIAADAPLKALRDEALAAAAVRAALAIEADRAVRDLEAARAEAQRLGGEILRLRADIERESRLGEDAQTNLERLAGDLAVTAREIAEAPGRTPMLEATARERETARAAAESAFEAIAARLAAAEAERRAATARVTAIRDQAAQAERTLAAARTERAGLGPLADSRLTQARLRAEAAAAAEVTAREALEAAEGARGNAARAEAGARLAMRAATDELAVAEAATKGLAAIVRTPRSDAFPAALDQIAVEPGLEGALAAALGDDLGAALDPRAAAYWAGREPTEVIWTAGVVGLATRIQAPEALRARLAFVGLVARDEGPRLRAELPPGTRLVSREGDLWRWDGFTVSASAPRPAQVRLEQRNQLAALEAQVQILTGTAGEARADHEAAAARLDVAETAVRLARAGPPAAASEATRAREALLVIEREGALKAARAEALDQAEARLVAERTAVLAPLAEAEARLAALPADSALAESLAEARAGAIGAREAAFVARADLDRERRATEGRTRRVESLRLEEGEWRERAGGAEARVAQLHADLAAGTLALDKLREAPERLERRRADLADRAGEAQVREAAAGGALAAAEDERVQRERAARAADARAADAREARAAAEAHLEAAIAKAQDIAQAIRDATGLDPAALAAQIAADAVAVPPDADGVEGHLAALKADLAALGGVNLRAEDDLADLTGRLQTLASERADLAGALARLRRAIEALEAEGRERLIAAFQTIDGHFRDLFTSLFQGGAAELRLVESADPLESGLEIFACPPGKRLAVMSLMSGGEQALVAVALIFAVFLSNPAPICVLDEVDAPLDDANVERFCDLLDAMRRRASTRFLTITHNPLTMSRMDRLFGVTMRERGVSQLVSVDLGEARRLAAS